MMRYSFRYRQEILPGPNLTQACCRVGPIKPFPPMRSALHSAGSRLIAPAVPELGFGSAQTTEQHITIFARRRPCRAGESIHARTS